MIDFTLRQLRYVLALAEEGHFGRAAERTFVSQPALSQQVRQVELACGTKLFERDTGGVRVTAFGRDFVERADRVVGEADSLIHFASSAAGHPQAPIRLGVIPTIAPYLLPVFYPALIQHLPQLAFAVSESRTDPLLNALATGELDLALIATDCPSNAGFASQALFDDPFVLAAPRSAHFEDPIVASELADAHMLLLDEGHCFRDQAIAACHVRSDQTSRTFSATSLATIVELVANGQGVTLLPKISLSKEVDADRIAIHQLAEPGAARTLSLVWRKSSPFAPLFTNIAQIIARACEPLVAVHPDAV